MLEPRSLVVLTDTAYGNLAHGIRETDEDALDDTVWNLDATGLKNAKGSVLRRSSSRVSLTIRHVPKVLKVKLFGGRFVNI